MPHIKKDPFLKLWVFRECNINNVLLCDFNLCFHCELGFG